MDKNWLIRTKSNHILGPISKEKVVELYQNGSIKADDEVCSGNGYWFFIREDDMVSRFLMGDEVQGFNPISEAKDVLTQAGSAAEKAPDDITMVSGVNIETLKEVSAPPPQTKTQNFEKDSVSKDAPSGDPKKKNNVNRTPKEKPVLKKQNYLQYISILGFIVLFLAIYFRERIINHLFRGEVTVQSLSLLDSAFAQEDVPAKKKSF